jgi:hypothetical protein
VSFFGFFAILLLRWSPLAMIPPRVNPPMLRAVHRYNFAGSVRANIGCVAS